jgi:integrase
VSFHDLRHACASKLIAAGLPATTVAAVLGHANPAITLSVCSHVFDQERSDDAVRAAIGGALS